MRTPGSKLRAEARDSRRFATLRHTISRTIPATTARTVRRWTPTAGFTSPPRGIRAPIGRWWLKSIALHGKEVLDAELELRESADDGVLTLSDRASELSGVVRQGEGAPAAEGFVVVFSSDPRFWFHNSRRVAGMRLSTEGKYVVRNLPAGEYLVAIASDIDVNEWFDPDVLKSLQREATRVSLQENEVKSLELTRRR